jgi:osmotically-inducible protein OsmY
MGGGAFTAPPGRHWPDISFTWRFTMLIRNTLAAAMTAAVLLTATGCAVTRGQETVGAYVDDTGITTLIKSRFIENKSVDAASISVETLNGTVMLSGFAKSGTERMTAENIARGVSGVKQVRNEIAIRP